MKYKIGEVGHILGISPDLLRHYEKKGIVHPEKDSTNDYRYYEPWDINFLMDCVWYKGFHFSLDQVAHIITDSTAQEVSDQLEEKEEQLREQNRRNELLIQRAQEHRADLARLESQAGRCDLRESPKVLRYFNRRGDLYDAGQALQDVSQTWLAYMPFAHRCFEMPAGAIAREDSRAHVSWGFSMTPGYVRELGVQVQPPLAWVESRPCIYTVFTSVGKDCFSPRRLQYVLQYAADHHLTPTGAVQGNLLASVQYQGRLTGFFEAWIPYEPAPV